LIDLAADTAASVAHRPAAVRQEGHFGALPAAIATPLAMALSELLLNAAEHARATTIEVHVERTEDQLRVWVSDDGIGFDAEATTGLGLQIVRTLVTEQISGALEWEDTRRGTRASIVARVPS
jgi:two-component sensor histidine kinase